MNLTIDQNIKNITPEFYIGGLIIDVAVYQDKSLDKEISMLENEISNKYDISDVISIPIIKDGRNAYKRYGKDPSRYRLAVESLFRRLSKGNKLYRINNVVDTGNLLSVKCKKSIAVVDYNKLKGDVFVRLGTEIDEYYGIGRGKLNVSKIPLYEDDLSPFGSVTSDTERTKICNETSKIMVLVISFSGKICLENDMQLVVKMYEKYCQGKEVARFVR